MGGDVEQEVERMARLVANLLQFSRSGNEQASTVNVPDELLMTTELTQHHLKRRGIEIKLEFESDLPAIFADRQKLRQVFLNLFTNAGDAMHGGGTLTTRVRRSSSSFARTPRSPKWPTNGSGRTSRRWACPRRRFRAS